MYHGAALRAKTEIPDNSQYLFAKGRQMKPSVFLPAFAALLLCVDCPAQESPSKIPAQLGSAATVPKNPDVETQFRQRQLAKMKREHSDDKGQLRPELFAKAVAQIQRMKVVSKPGATPKQPANKP